MSANRITGADVAVEQLQALGVELIWGIPGVHNLALFDALDRSSIKTVLVRHEQTAVYAADGYARATGRLGVALTTTGPGAANTAGAMGEARAARSSVLHISTQLPSHVIEGKSGRGGLHESPQQRELMGAVAVWSERVSRAEAIAQLVVKAAEAAFKGRRGPAFLEIPLDFLETQVTAEPRSLAQPSTMQPDESAVRRAIAALQNSAKPIIWAGGGAVAASDAVQELAEKLDAPVVTTFSGRGVLPASHPLAVTLPPHEPKITALIESSDCMVVIGSDLDAMNTMGWRIAMPRPRISINTVADDARRNYAADVVLETDARTGIASLMSSLDRKPKRKTAARRIQTATTSAEKSLAKSEGFKFARSIEAAASKHDATVVCDMAVGAYWVAGYTRFESPRRLLYPLGWGTLGFSLPAAVGAAATGGKVLVVTGDAGALYAIGELGTFVQEGLDVCILVVNDNGYGMLRFDTQRRFSRNFADTLKNPDFCALADSFGMATRKARPSGLAAALKWGLSSKEPTLIELKRAMEPPPTTSPRWHRAGTKEMRP